MNLLIRNILFVILFCVFFAACKKDNFTTDSGAKLELSTDTVIFDTIFTTIGSTTRQFKIYNRNSEYLKISTIYLANGNNTHFSLNINGIRANQVSNIEIPPKDSLYIFVQVKLGQNNLNDPMVITDSVVFITNGNKQDVKLVAFGQDVNLLIRKNQRDSLIVLSTQTWNSTKPYLIYNRVLVGDQQTLTINAGTKIYFHRNTGLFVLGTLNVDGTKDNPVIFRNDRLEHVYDDVPSQWDGVAFLSGSKLSTINFAEIRNGVTGLQVGTPLNLDNGHASVILKNTKIENMSYACLFAFSSIIEAYNCVFTNAGYYTSALTAGGNYNFYHCTLANYWNSTRTEPSLIISNNLPYDNTLYVGAIKAYFGNSIIYGNNINEIGSSKDGAASLEYTFENSLIKIDPATITTDLNFYKNIYKNTDPIFKSTYDKYDFQLDTLSFAKDKGNPDIINLNPHSDWLRSDIKGILRDALPDLGAYERKEN